MLQVDANARPRGRSSAHRIDENVGRLEHRCDVRVLLLPRLERLEGFVFLERMRDRDQGMF